MNTKESHVNPSEEEPCYWAFISYSHQNKAWGEWVQRQLERYRIPRRFVGSETSQGRLPRRLTPIFRDEAELPTSSDLGNAIRDALMASRTLIVVCSPNAVKSRWVNQEIVTFKSLPGDRRHRVLCLIVDGEPNATDKPQLRAKECFPEAIRFEVDAAGRLTDQRVEPIAADVRAGASGRRVAKLKLIAGVIGVGFDELWQRDAIWRRQRLVLILAVLSAIGLLIYLPWHAAQRADRRVRVLQEVSAKEMNQALHEIRTKESNSPFPRMTGRYAQEEQDLLRQRLGRAAEVFRVVNARLERGMATCIDAGKAARELSMVKAEVAWAGGDFALTESNLVEAVSHARKAAEGMKRLTKIKGSAADFYSMEAQVIDSALDQAESALIRLRQFRQSERK